MYLTSLEGFAVASLIGGAIGLLFGLSGSRADSFAGGFLLGAAVAGVHGTGIALGTLRGGPENGALWGTLLSPFGAYIFGSLAAIGIFIDDPMNPTIAALAGYGATLLVAPLLTALLYEAAPMRTGPVVVSVGPGSIAGRF